MKNFFRGEGFRPFQCKLALFALLPIFLIVSCGSASDEQRSANVSGTITVDESLDDSADYSGFVVEIMTYREDREDIVYKATTDKAGYFEGTAKFNEDAEFVFIVSRNENRLASNLIILANNDSVRVSAQFPDFPASYLAKSHQNEAYSVYQRLQRQFDRIVLHLNAGNVPEDEIEQQIRTWVNLFWDIREQYPNTLAASRAAASAIEALSGWDDREALAKIEEAAGDNSLTDVALSVGTTAKLRLEGLDEAIRFLDGLKSNASREVQKLNIDITAIELLYDSLRIDEVKRRLDKFERDYDTNPYQSWLNSMRYDVDVLAPGLALPTFSFKTTNGETITIETFRGKYVMLEFVRFDNRLYQQLYPELVNFYREIKTDALEFVTVPAHDSQITVDAFFSERPKAWAVANASEYAKENLPEKLNLYQLPVRFLIDKEGKIIKKYYETGYDQISVDLLKLLQ